MPRGEGVHVVTTPPEDDDLIERLDAGKPARSPEEATARRPYEQLFADIRALENIAPPPGWEERAVANLAAAKRKERLRTVLTVSAGGAALSAIVAALVLMPCGVPAPGLSVAVVATSGAARRGDSAVGDVLHVQARIDRPHVDLRVYLNTRLVARCPGSDVCRSSGVRVDLDWKLAEPGTYRVVVLSSDGAIPPGDGTLDRDLLEARDAAATSTTETIVVRP
jgi:hypothetical protein